MSKVVRKFTLTPPESRSIKVLASVRKSKKTDADTPGLGNILRAFTRKGAIAKAAPRSFFNHLHQRIQLAIFAVQHVVNRGFHFIVRHYPRAPLVRP